MNVAQRSLFVIGIVVLSVFAGVAIPDVVAAQDTSDNDTTIGDGTSTANGTVIANATATASLMADPATTGARSNHTVNITLSDVVADNLTGVRINYSGTNVSTNPVITGDKAIVLANQSIPVSSNATTVSVNNFVAPTFSFNLNQSLQPEAGDQLTLVYTVRHPPEASNHTVEILINPDTNAIELTTNLTITPNETAPGGVDNGTTTSGVNNETETTSEDGGTGVDNETGATTEEAGAGAGGETTTEEAGAGAGGETTTEEAGAGAGGETTTGNGPGFTVVAGLVALLAVALLALRRN